jgi:hypothetical protein
MSNKRPGWIRKKHPNPSEEWIEKSVPLYIDFLNQLNAINNDANVA